jgi:hypothetical protein
MNHEVTRNGPKQSARSAHVHLVWSCASSLLLLLFVFQLAGAEVLAQKRKSPAPAPAKEKKQSEQPTAAEQLTATRDEFVKKTNEYKQSLAELLTFYEKDVKQAEDKQTKLQELYAAGLLAKRDLDANAKEIEDAKTKVAETQKQMQTADDQIAETLVEEKTIEQAALAPPPKPGKLIKTTAYIRYNGPTAWSLALGAVKVESFFLQKFGRQLPISAYGQTAVHNRLGFDHRNAMDVPVNPGSAEGQALMAYLRANGIPFFAFYMAIPGSATGAHIHIGQPSHRISTPLATH